jgi:hypothetical protein
MASNREIAYMGPKKLEIQNLDFPIEAYHIFDEGSPKKLVIDPHGSVRK